MLFLVQWTVKVLKKEREKKRKHTYGATMPVRTNDSSLGSDWQIQIQQPALNPNQSDCSVGLACVVV